MSQDSASSTNDVGIDVCKDWLDVHLMPADIAERFPNDKKGHKALLGLLKRHHVRRVLMEATGKYHRGAHDRLHDAGHAVTIVNPSRARKFAESIGCLAKTDKVDARMLALFAGWAGHVATPPLPASLANLQEIVRFREEAVADRTALSNQLKTATNKIVRRQLEARIEACGKAAEQLAQAAREAIDADPAFARRHEILVSIPGIGATTAASLIANAAELGSLDEKEAAMLAGLAPLACESGTSIGKRRIRGGRANVRTACYMPTLQAVRVNAPLRDFYERLLAKGKAKKLALTAVMRKLIVLANALLKDDRLWSLTPPKTIRPAPIHA